MTQDTVHNPDRFMGDLRTILSQGRKRIGLLLGAGAPVGIRLDACGNVAVTGRPLIPDVAGLTQGVLSTLEGGHLAATRAIMDDSGPDPNIETILSKIRLMERALASDTVHGLDGPGYRELGRRICEEIGNRVKASLPPQPNGYTELVSWIGGTARRHPVEVFTTNYDLLLEEAFERVSLPYFDGFTGAWEPFFDAASVASSDLPPRWTRLWKLHGSLGWALRGDRVVRTGFREANELIYPDHLKYDRIQRQPYTALFDRLKRFLMEPDTLLLTTGFSFNDSHICAVIDDALHLNPNAAVFALNYSNLDTSAALHQFALRRPNLSVYARDKAVIGSVAGRWQVGELPSSEWEEIRRSFWHHGAGQTGSFTLGDFGTFARFCALAQSVELVAVPPPAPPPAAAATAEEAPVAA